MVRIYLAQPFCFQQYSATGEHGLDLSIWKPIIFSSTGVNVAWGQYFFNRRSSHAVLKRDYSCCVSTAANQLFVGALSRADRRELG